MRAGRNSAADKCIPKGQAQRGFDGVDWVYGVAAAILLGWLSIKLGSWFRVKTGIEVGRTAAIAAGVVIALGLWFGLRLLTGLPRTLIDAMGIGPAVGLSQGLRKPHASKGR